MESDSDEIRSTRKQTAVGKRPCLQPTDGGLMKHDDPPQRSPVRTTVINSAGLRVSRIGLGCVTFGREIDEAAAFPAPGRGLGPLLLALQPRQCMV